MKGRTLIGITRQALKRKKSSMSFEVRQMAWKILFDTNFGVEEIARDRASK
jgi:hypothetical protein